MYVTINNHSFGIFHVSDESILFPQIKHFVFSPKKETGKYLQQKILQHCPVPQITASIIQNQVLLAVNQRSKDTNLDQPVVSVRIAEKTREQVVNVKMFLHYIPLRVSYLMGMVTSHLAASYKKNPRRKVHFKNQCSALKVLKQTVVCTQKIKCK